MSKRPVKPTILLIDDEERILRTLAVLFKQSHQVFKTSDPDEFMQILESEHIHVIISDQRMPKKKGSDLLREAKVVSPNSMRILLTGYADLDGVVASINEGEIFRYITKPWDPNELKRTVVKATEIALKLEYKALGKNKLSEISKKGANSNIPDSLSIDDLNNPNANLRSPAQIKRKVTKAAEKPPKPLRPVEKEPKQKPYVQTKQMQQSSDLPKEKSEAIAPISTPQASNQIVASSNIAKDKHKEKVLVIDDSPVMYNKIKAMFANKLAVSFASDLESATDELAQNDVAVAICDTKLNGVDIAPIIKTLKQTSPELVSIVITSFQDTGMLIDLINEGQIYRCLPKPVSTNMLNKSIRHAINHYHKLKTDPSEQLRHAVELRNFETDDSVNSENKITSFIRRLRNKLSTQ